MICLTCSYSTDCLLRFLSVEYKSEYCKIFPTLEPLSPMVVQLLKEYNVGNYNDDDKTIK